MKKAIAWQIDGVDGPKPLELGKLDLEKQLEDWIEKDVSIVADDVLIIGRQIPTKYGTVIDLLGRDTRGELVIIELKRNQTLRDTVAQGLEYAAWVSKLGYSDVIQRGAQKFESEEAFREAFEDRFGTPLPETVNAGQRIVVVAPEISDATASVIAYLSESYGVPINGVSFDVFSVAGKQIVVRQVVREENQTPISSTSKQQPSRTREQFIALAEKNHVGDAFKRVLELENDLPTTKFFVNGMRFSAKAPDNRTLTVLNAFPTAETYKHQLAVYVPPQNLAKLYGIPQTVGEALVQDLQQIGKSLPSWGGWPGIGLTTGEQAERFVSRFRQFLANPSA